DVRRERDGPHRSHWRERAELVARVSRGCVRGRTLMPRRRLLLALVIAGAIVVVGGGTGAALCKFKYQCGIGSLFNPSSSGYANDKALLERLQVEGKHARLGTLAAGFSEHVLAKGFTLPTDFAFLSPTSILVGEKSGVIRVWSAKTQRARVVLDLEPRL